MTIAVHALTKRFDSLQLGKRVAVSNLSFSVKPGEVYGLIGPNGAGKTTTMRMVAGLIRPSSGKALICGRDVVAHSVAAKGALGFLSGSAGLYKRLSVYEVLSYFGELYGVSSDRVDKQITSLASQLELTDIIDQRCGTLSTGQRQRVALARCCVHDPPALMLDEPTASLDVLASRFVADTIRKWRDQGKAILFSTHYLTEAELLCDRVGIIDRGRLLAEGSPGELKHQHGVDSLEALLIRLHHESPPEPL